MPFYLIQCTLSDFKFYHLGSPISIFCAVSCKRNCNLFCRRKFKGILPLSFLRDEPQFLSADSVSFDLGPILALKSPQMIFTYAGASFRTDNILSQNTSNLSSFVPSLEHMPILSQRCIQSLILALGMSSLLEKFHEQT